MYSRIMTFEDIKTQESEKYSFLSQQGVLWWGRGCSGSVWGGGGGGGWRETDRQTEKMGESE